MAGERVNNGYVRAEAITPSDTSPHSPPYEAIYVGTSSSANIKITTPDGDVVVFDNVIQGGIIPVRASLVWSTGTTASNLVGLR